MEKALLGQLLVWNKLITQAQLERTLLEQKKSKLHKKLGQILIDLGFIKEDDLNAFLSKQYNVEQIDLKNVQINPDIINKIPVKIAKKYRIVPIDIDNEKRTIKIATSDPTNIYALDDVRFITGLRPIPLLAKEKLIENAIDKYYGSSKEISTILEDLSSQNNTGINIIDTEDREENIDDLKNQSSKEPIVNLANSIIKKAIESKASDIHIENFEKIVRVRLRIDGILRTIMEHPKNIAPALISRLKIMSRLDISEKRLPQDGRMRLNVGGKNIDFRISTLPTTFGENIALRILDRSSVNLDLHTLGFEAEDLKKYEQAIKAPYGMILNTGPTGSGKTTTMYASLHKINREDINILTIENPIEYNLEGINQVQVKEDIGLTFAEALRAFLRQDPDVIMVGEIRDHKTAEIAIRSALTGHLVLSTLHTNDAFSSVTRLADMGIERYLITSSIIMVLAQRLIRKICSQCKQEIFLPSKAKETIGFSKEDAENIKIYKGKGCEYCDYTGYKGRIAIYEVMPISSKIKSLILENAPLEKIKSQAIKEGSKTLRMNGLNKVKEGITTIEEVMSSTFS